VKDKKKKKKKNKKLKTEPEGPLDLFLSLEIRKWDYFCLPIYLCLCVIVNCRRGVVAA